MRFKLKDIDKKWKEYALAGCVCILFFVFITNLGKIWSAVSGLFVILSPLFLGFIIAYIVNPMAVFFQDKLFKGIKREKIQWSLSVLLTLIVVLSLIVLLISMLIPQIADNVVSLADNYSVYVNRLKDFLSGIGDKIGGAAIVDNIINDISAESGLINKIGTLVAENAHVLIEKTTSIGAAAVNFLIGFIFAIYFLISKKGILQSFSRTFSLMLSPLKYERLRMLLAKFNGIFSKYIVCELLDSLIVGAANYVFMALCSMPDALFVSVIVGVTNLAPTFGPVVGAAIGGFILLLIDPSTVIPFLIFTFVLQTIDGYVIKPKLFGGALNVPGVIILIFIIVFGKLMGVPGMLISIPAAAIFVYTYTEGFIPWLELRKDLQAYRKEQEKEKH